MDDFAHAVFFTVVRAYRGNRKKAINGQLNEIGKQLTQMEDELSKLCEALAASNINVDMIALDSASKNPKRLQELCEVHLQTYRTHRKTCGNLSKYSLEEEKKLFDMVQQLQRDVDELQLDVNDSTSSLHPSSLAQPDIFDDNDDYEASFQPTSSFEVYEESEPPTPRAGSFGPQQAHNSPSTPGDPSNGTTAWRRSSVFLKLCAPHLPAPKMRFSRAPTVASVGIH